MDIDKENVDFGDYCTIEQKRYSAPNEFYSYKVVGRKKSNAWTDVPVDANNEKETLHDHLDDVVTVICNNLDDRTVHQFRVSDLASVRKAKAQAVPEWISTADQLPVVKKCSEKLFNVVMLDYKSEPFVTSLTYMHEYEFYDSEDNFESERNEDGYVYHTGWVNHLNDDFFESIEADKVLYWMELPKVIEAQEPKVTALKVEWTSDCFNCGYHEAIIYSTASEAASKGWFHDGDKAQCCKCGHEGEMDARGEDSDIVWNEDDVQEQAND